MSQNDSATSDSNGPDFRPNYLANCHFPSRGRETIMLVNADGSLGIIDAKAVAGDVSSLPAGYFTSLYFIGTVAAQCLAGMAAYLAWILSGYTLNSIDQDIGPSVSIGWATTTWLMGASVSFLLFGRLSDLFGRKWMVLATTSLGLMGCILGGAAQNIPMIIVANVFFGIAAAGQFAFAVILGELVPNKQRGPIVTLGIAASLPFIVFGPAIAESLIEQMAEGWRWGYYIGIIINSMALILYWFSYYPPSFTQLNVGKSRMQQAREIDWFGLFLYVVSCCLFLTGLSWGADTNAYAWDSPQVLCTLLLGMVSFALFVIYEGLYCRVQPLVPLRMFRNVGFDAFIATATISFMVYYTLVILWPSMLRSVYERSNMQAASQSSTLGGGLLLGQIFAGFAISYLPRVRFQAIAASVLVLVFTVALASISEDRWAHTTAFGFLICFGGGYMTNLALPGVALLWSPQDIGLASGILGSIVCLGGAVAHAIFTSIFTHVLHDNVTSYVTVAAMEAGLPNISLPGLLQGVSGGAHGGALGVNATIVVAVDGALIDANGDAFRMVLYSLIPFTALLVLAACFMPDMESHLTNNVPRRLQHDRRRHERDDGSFFV
ncbi:fungal trichothecene efflux pump [Stachybotrys elegans]|uniref:Fungal trichothecene efflux pump n=1 Tax=Stachybotrys elegans TaxID=80388 RepID=A0A8K0SQE7_9HYPO|nr:fungal trichothecene efflux pump [Stachybotrys elegans]